MYKQERKNYAQKAREDSHFIDDKVKTEKERVLTGVYIDITRYSDGSSTHHFGGPCGSVDYNENGEEC